MLVFILFERVVHTASIYLHIWYSCNWKKCGLRVLPMQ